IAARGYAHAGSGVQARMLVADAQRELHDTDAALATLTTVLADARALDSKPKVLKTLLFIGDVDFDLGRNADARQAYVEAAALAEKLDEAHERSLALFGIASLDLKERRFADAEKTSRALLDHIAAKEAEVRDEAHRLTYSTAMRNGQAMLLAALAGQD